MPFHPIFRPPTRVSRLYPLMTLALMIGSSSLVYAWQSSQLSGDAAVQDRDRQIAELRLTNEQLSAQFKLDQASIQTQKTQLSSLNDQLKTAESDLTTKTQALKDADTQLTSQKDQLNANASELQSLRSRPPLFSFQNKSSLPDIEQKEADVKSVVTAAYDYIQALYGQPYLLHTVTITFVDSFSIEGASGEIEISNGPQGISIDIHLKDFDKTNFQDVNTIIHEMVHAFHGIGVIDTSALEEGITVATTDAVMANLISDGKIEAFPQLYLVITEPQYQNYNGTLLVKANNTAFYQDSHIAQVYQMIGYAWYKLYNQDHGFLKKFNDAYYARIQKGQKVDAAGVRDIIASIESQVGGTAIGTFLANNRAFNPN